MRDDDEPPKPLSHEERRKLFDLPEPKPVSAPPAPVARPSEEHHLELDVERGGAAGEEKVIERIRVGGLAVLVRVFVFATVFSLLLWEGLRWVFRH